jgi:hypothetical protein
VAQDPVKTEGKLQNHIRVKIKDREKIEETAQTGEAV